MKFPITAFSNNIIFTKQGKAYAIYKFSGRPYNFFDLGHKQVVVSEMEDILAGFVGTGQILLLWEEMNVDWASYYNRNIKANEPAFKELGEEHAKAVEYELSFGTRNLRRYIVLELDIKNTLNSIDEFLLFSRDAATKTFLGLRPMDIPEKLKKQAHDTEKELFSRFRKHNIERITFNDLDFIIRKTALKIGILPQPLPDRPSGIFTPAAITAFTEGVLLKEKLNHIKVTDTLGKVHYQSFLHFVDVPSKLPAHGVKVFSTEYFYFPFDSCIHFEVLSSHKALQEVDRKKRLLTGQMMESADANQQASLNEEIGLAISDILQQKLESGETLAKVSVCISVADTDLKELNSKTAELITHFLQMSFRAVRPSAKQFESMLSFLPGSKPSAPMIACDPGFIAAMGMNFASDLGDPEGFVLGRTGQMAVFWSPGRPARELNKTNAILISGSLGGGKSVLTKDLGFFTLIAGGYVLATDPKEEYWSFKNLFGENYVKVIDISPRGGIALNPFTLAEDNITAQSIAQNYLQIVLNATGKESRILAISQAVNKLFQLNREERNMYTFMECLGKVAEENPHHNIKQEAEQCIYLLQAMENTNMGRIVFGRDNQTFFTDKIRMIDINIKEIPRPKPNTDPSRYTEEERQGLALIYLIAAIAREAAFSLPRNIPKMLIFDEAWVIASITEGENLLEEVIRIGRSYNLIPVLISQNMSDLDKPVFINNASQIFCFRALSAEETKTNLRILGADIDSVRPDTFAKLRPGQCIYRDAEGKIGFLNNIILPPRLLTEYFDSNPQTSSKTPS